LTHAIKQVNDWKIWIEDNKDYFIKTLNDKIHELDPTTIDNHFGIRNLYRVIIMGQRKDLTQNDYRSITTIEEDNKITIFPYDRLVDFEEKALQQYYVGDDEKGNPTWRTPDFSKAIIGD
jgi:hypothetical protein